MSLVHLGLLHARGNVHSKQSLFTTVDGSCWDVRMVGGAFSVTAGAGVHPAAWPGA